jgi:membrane-associated PAP2 superfamily phosphatase
MKPRCLLEVLSLLAFLVAATGMIAVSGADLAVSSMFYFGGKWPVGDRFFWQLLYHLDRIPSISLGAVGLAVFLISFTRVEYCRWRRSGIFLLLLLLLGPGLLVNVVFKDNWGRPRPRDVVEFGGKMEFLHPWQKVDDGTGRSFPSGHSSGAFYMAAPYLVYRRSDRRRAYAWLAGGLLFGIVMSIARITQGAHFLSDTLWSFGMVSLVALLLAWLLDLDGASEASPVPKV